MSHGQSIHRALGNRTGQMVALRATATAMNCFNSPPVHPLGHVSNFV